MSISYIYQSVTGCTQIESISVTDNHTAPTATALVVCGATTLDIGDEVTIDIGYNSNHQQVLIGYAKDIQLREPEKLYNITISNIMIRAVDYYLVSSNPDKPFKRSNIKAENLIRDLLKISGITSYTADVTNFTFAVHNPMEVNLTSIYDYCRFIADILAYSVYADSSGVAHFANRRPYVVGSDVSVATITDYDILDFLYSYSDNDLRNRIVVYGSEGIYAEAKAVSPYLPSGYYKSAAVSAPGVIDTQNMATQSASYNLALLNRLTYRCNMTIIGNPSLAVRQVVTLDKPDIAGVSGDWYVYGIEHSISKDGYVTSIELRK